MVDKQLLFYAFLTAGGYLLVISLLLEYLCKIFKINQSLPPQLKEETGAGWFVMNYIMELLFYVAIPTIGYGFLFLILPLEGVKAGMAAVLFALLVGAVPVVMGLTVRVKLPIHFLTFILLSYFIKLAGTLIIIGYLYTL